jgi:hypothetical protein
MSDLLPGPQDAARLLVQLRRGQALRRRRGQSAPMDPQLAVLRNWQAQRLAGTYADLLESPRYAPAGRFFLTDIYAPRDFTRRDQDVEEMYRILLSFLPPRMLKPLALTIELHNVTEELDQALLEVLVNQLGMTDSVTEQLYAEGYRICDNYAERVQQINLIVEVGRGVDRLVHLPLVGTTLRLARWPAERTGWSELHDFLRRGFAAFKHMQGAGTFLGIIQEREMRILDKIFAGDPDPFAV